MLVEMAAILVFVARATQNSTHATRVKSSVERVLQVLERSDAENPHFFMI